MFQILKIYKIGTNFVQESESFICISNSTILKQKAIENVARTLADKNNAQEVQKLMSRYFRLYITLWIKIFQ
jgi:hypothetical protein